MRFFFSFSAPVAFPRSLCPLLLLVAGPAALHAQTPGGPGPMPGGGTTSSVGINTTSPDPSAVLDIQSVSQGVLIPRLTRLQRLAIANPKPGLMVYQAGSPAAADSAGFWLRGPVGWLFLAPQLPTTLSKTGSQISLGGAGSGSVTDSDDQQLSATTASGTTTLALSNGGTATVPAAVISKTGTQISLSGGGSGSVTDSDDQQLSATTTSGVTTITLTNGGTATVPAAVGDNLGSHSATQPLALNDQPIRLRTATDTNHSLAYDNTLDGPRLQGNFGGALGTPGATVLRWNSNGNVGIGTGTVAPRGRLDVGSGDTYLVQDANTGSGQSLFLPGHLWLAPYSGTSGTAYIQARVPNPTGKNIGIILRTTDNGVLRDALSLNANGSAVFYSTVTATSFTPSDQRLKQDIRPLGAALPKVLALRGVRYTYRQNIPNRPLPTSEQVGLLAQEVERIYPELVTTGADGYKAVNYAQLTPVLLEAIKELAAQNTALEAQVAGQQQTLTADHASLQSLQAQMDRLQEAISPAGQARR